MYVQNDFFQCIVNDLQKNIIKNKDASVAKIRTREEVYHKHSYDLCENWFMWEKSIHGKKEIGKNYLAVFGITIKSSTLKPQV